MRDEKIIAGTIIYGEEPSIIEGYVCIRDGKITEVGTGTSVDANITGLAVPCFVNAHTHIGDSILKDPLISDLDSLVRPPDGIKHRILRSTPAEEIKKAMMQTISDMLLTGTCTFCDFREGGIQGILMLLESMADFKSIDGIIMGRPELHDSPAVLEIEEILDKCDGLGISGVNDAPLHIIEQMERTVRNNGKMFAIHAGEKDASDISAAIRLEPDFIIHMTCASGSDIALLKEKGIPVVVCPRSNLLTGTGSPGRPQIREMLDKGITVAVGTDNVMLNSVNMFSEMEFLSKVFRLEDRQVFKMCTLNGAKILRLEKRIGSITEGKQARMMVLDDSSPNLINSSNLLSSLVRRGRPDNIKAIIGGMVP